MSALKPVLAVAALMAVTAPATAQETSPWDLRDRNAYVLDTQGKMWSTRASAKGWTMMTKSARAVPKGTVFFMNNGQLYMARAGLWDRAGNFMAGGV
jgi:hypothetical protein